MNNLQPRRIRTLTGGRLAALVVTLSFASAALAQPAAAPSAAPAATQPAAFAACGYCHEVTAGARPSVGPNLFNVGGRKAGSGDFDFSDALKGSGVTWSAETLQAFVLDPSKAVPGNKMDYPGAADAATAKAIADYLMSLKG